MQFQVADTPVTINVASRAALEARLGARLAAGTGFALATLNLDHLVKLKQRGDFRAAYAAQDFVVADGNPVVWLSRLAGRPVELVPGADLVVPLARLAAEADVPVALCGSTPEALAAAALPASGLQAATPTPVAARPATADPVPVVAAADPAAQTLSASAVQAAALPGQPAPADRAGPAALPAPFAAATFSPEAPRAEAAAPSPQIAALAPAEGTPAAAAPATGQRAPAASADGEVPAEPPLPASRAKAATAWQFGDRVVTDPAAIATISAFMAPEEAGGEDVRDDLSSVLTNVDCARLSATFIPETGTLEMRGHVPDPSLEGPILEALREQVGEGIPVRANLLHLPAPQCGALTGIADVGLPQSTDQFTNARLIGQTAHAREYDYSEGQRLQFDLTAPDYDAYVYVDYFNAAGDACAGGRTVHQALVEGLQRVSEVGGARIGDRTMIDALAPAPPLRAAYLIWRDPFMTVGRDTIIHDIMTRGGFDNVFADRTRYPEVTLDELAAADPDVLLLPDEPFPFPQKDAFSADLREELPDTRLQFVDGQLFSWYGSRLLDTPTYLADLHADLSA